MEIVPPQIIMIIIIITAISILFVAGLCSPHARTSKIIIIIISDNRYYYYCCCRSLQHSKLLNRSYGQYSIVQYSIGQYSIAQHSIAQYSIVQYSIVQYSIAQHTAVLRGGRSTHVFRPSFSHTQSKSPGPSSVKTLKSQLWAVQYSIA